jgi:hypothetical protein
MFMDLKFSFTLLACIGVLPLAQHLAAQSSTAPAPSDFNGDGIPDIVWHNRNTGDTGVWFMDSGGRILGSAGLPGWSDGDINWWIAGVADFNRDGKPDLFWRNYGNGRNAVWLLDGTTVLSVIDLPPQPDTDWSLCGAADFNGDGQLDLVWRNFKTAENRIWLMNGAQIRSTVTLDPVNGEWQIVGISDLNGDQKPDLLWGDFWRGQIEAWIMDGTSVISKRSVGTWPDANVRMQALTVDGAGQPAILWRNYLNGSNYLMPLANFHLGAAVNLPTVSDTAWQIAGSYVLDPNTLLSTEEQNILKQEDLTLAGGGYDDLGPYTANSSLYTIHGERVLTFPSRDSASKMFQARKQLLDSAYNNARLNQMAVETEMGGYNATDPETGLQAWFLNGTKEWIWGDFTWK